MTESNSVLTVSQLLEVEQICDSYENALIAERVADIEDYVRRADVSLRPLIREELRAINSSRLLQSQDAAAHVRTYRQPS